MLENVVRRERARDERTALIEIKCRRRAPLNSDYYQ